jgi:hypothetical protein
VETEEVRLILLPRNDLLRAAPGTPLAGTRGRAAFARRRGQRRGGQGARGGDGVGGKCAATSLFDETVRKPSNPDTQAVWLHVQVRAPPGPEKWNRRPKGAHGGAGGDGDDADCCCCVA